MEVQNNDVSNIAYLINSDDFSLTEEEDEEEIESAFSPENNVTKIEHVIADTHSIDYVPDKVDRLSDETKFTNTDSYFANEIPKDIKPPVKSIDHISNGIEFKNNNLHTIKEILDDTVSVKNRLDQLPDNLGTDLRNLCGMYGSEFVVKDFILCFFRVLFPKGNPRNDRNYWFHIICYEKIAKHIGSEFNINVGEFNSAISTVIITTPLNKYVDYLLEIELYGHFDKLYNKILDGFQILSDILQITNDVRYKSVVTVIKELTGSFPDYLLPGQTINPSGNSNQAKPSVNSTMNKYPQKNISNTRGNNLHLDNYKSDSRQYDNKNFKKGGFQGRLEKPGSGFSPTGNRSLPEYKSNSENKFKSTPSDPINKANLVDTKSESIYRPDKVKPSAKFNQIDMVKFVESKSDPIDKVKSVVPKSNPTDQVNKVNLTDTKSNLTETNNSDKKPETNNSDKKTETNNSDKKPETNNSDKKTETNNSGKQDNSIVREKPNRANHYGKLTHPTNYTPKKKSDRPPIN
jgi:hypothetical protein